ncbi:MAG: endolytic transglycosylase MltG, partial [Muribaculaceae bacterium]|nr:endolytic transglycosylase MltG [Muribaculaceae bacterium]
QDPVKMTFNNVRTLPELAGRVSSQLMLSADEFMEACDSVLPAAGFRKPEYVAAFLPDTYEFYWTSDPVATVERLLEYRNRFWSDERRAQARAMGLTPVQAATIASIAEEETNDRAERATVARLYLNRVQRGMPLQADPTVKFAVGDFSLRRILSKHLATPSPYNTYIHKGLPPGPIRVAERATMEALLNSSPHNYIYMCARPDFSGRHNFAASYAEHQRNAAAYHRALNARSVK